MLSRRRWSTSEGTAGLYRENVLKSTVLHLKEHHRGTELFVIGTLNRSNVLANRTRRLIQEIKPDTLFVQTNQE